MQFGVELPLLLFEGYNPRCCDFSHARFLQHICFFSTTVFLCTAETGWLDGKHVVFGQVTKGLNVVKEVERYGSESGATKKPVVVTDCGQLNK